MKDLGEASYVLRIKNTKNRRERTIRLSQETYYKKILEIFEMENFSLSLLTLSPPCPTPLSCLSNSLSLLSLSDTPPHKAPELHLEVHKQMFTQPASGSGSSTTSNVKRAKKKEANDEWIYTAAGWVVLGVLVVAVMSLTRPSYPPPAPPR
ncbi:hypothetical protein AMTRI_Chr06g194280 [Amborella trichopoda]